MTIQLEIEEEIAPGLKYTEETGWTVRSLPVRYCYLWQTGVEEPISDLEVLSFRQRFGAISIPAEGIGGVETLPQFRRQGHMSRVLSTALTGMARRVAIAFVSDGIEEAYEKFGFVNCLAEGYLSVPVRNVERMAASSGLTVDGGLRAFSQADLPAIVKLYNEVHAQRPWTHERHTGWNRLRATQIWQPGSEVIVLERLGRLAGYAILNEQQFGHRETSVVVDELTASDAESALALLVEVAARCWQLRSGAFTVREPLDSVVGKVAQKLGCTYQQTFLPSGGMMGLILDRQRLLLSLEPELRRRLPREGFGAAHTTAFEALCRGEIVADNQLLLRLLVGYWSMTDALAFGMVIPAQYRPVFGAWFPGGGTNSLPIPYAHTLDRY